eukprot:m.62195 g.62195  ORF g.62195 m.62195 type:complete len:578 (-) comp11494_c0_seq4:166-1899(-)
MIPFGILFYAVVGQPFNECAQLCPAGEGLFGAECGLNNMTIEYNSSLVNCLPCPSGSYSAVIGQICKECTTCHDDLYQARKCQADRNTLCAACQECTSDEVEFIACSELRNTRCMPINETGFGMLLFQENIVVDIYTLKQQEFESQAVRLVKDIIQEYTIDTSILFNISFEPSRELSTVFFSFVLLPYRPRMEHRTAFANASLILAYSAILSQDDLENATGLLATYIKDRLIIIFDTEFMVDLSHEENNTLVECDVQSTSNFAALLSMDVTIKDVQLETLHEAISLLNEGGVLQRRLLASRNPAFTNLVNFTSQIIESQDNQIRGPVDILRGIKTRVEDGELTFTVTIGSSFSDVQAKDMQILRTGEFSLLQMNTTTTTVPSFVRLGGSDCDQPCLEWYFWLLIGLAIAGLVALVVAVVLRERNTRVPRVDRMIIRPKSLLNQVNMQMTKPGEGAPGFSYNPSRAAVPLTPGRGSSSSLSDIWTNAPEIPSSTRSKTDHDLRMHYIKMNSMHGQSSQQETEAAAMNFIPERHGVAESMHPEERMQAIAEMHNQRSIEQGFTHYVPSDFNENFTTVVR